MTSQVLECDFCCKEYFDTEMKMPGHYVARAMARDFGWRVIDGKDMGPKCIQRQFRTMVRADMWIKHAQPKNISDLS